MKPFDTIPDHVRTAADSIGLDLVALHALLGCGGPSLADELRRRFLSDLAVAEAGLRGASSCAAAERHVHVLLGLAGQAGAGRLHGWIGQAHAAARLGDAPRLATLLPILFTGTAALAAVVAGVADPGFEG